MPSLEKTVGAALEEAELQQGHVKVEYFGSGLSGQQVKQILCKLTSQDLVGVFSLAQKVHLDKFCDFGNFPV